MDKMPPYLIEASREGDLPSFIKMFSGGLVYEIYDTDTDVMKKIKEFMAMYGISDIKMRMPGRLYANRNKSRTEKVYRQCCRS